MRKKQHHGSSEQKTTAYPPDKKDQGIKNKTTPTTSKKMDRPMDDDAHVRLNPVRKNTMPDNDEDIDDIVVREDNFDEDIKDYTTHQAGTEEESNEDL